MTHLRDVPVICYGIRSDFRGEPFPGAAYLLTLADSIEELKTVCACGKKATMNVRLDADGKRITQGAQIAIEGDVRYVQQCAGLLLRGRRRVTPLHGRVAIVAGASGGIGVVTVRALLREGMQVVLAAPQDALLDAIAREVEAFGERVLVVPTDITRSDEVDALVARTLVRFRRIDVLVNVAGIGSSPSFCDTSGEEIERVLAVNLLGAARTIHAVLPVMKAQRSGSIVNVGSVAGEVAVMGIYSASKFGLRGLNDSVRREVRSEGIGVTLIEPGFVRTTMNPA